MMGVSAILSFVTVISVLQPITSGFPIISNNIRVLRCSPVCPDPSNFKYVKDMSYRFAYSMEASTQTGGVNKEESRLTVTSDVKIDVIGRCEMALRLHNTQVHVSNERGILKKAKKEELNAFKQAVQEFALRFSFQDGIVKNLCLEAGNSDPPWVLNFKRGILSVFQSSMEDWRQNQNVTEIDIVGECPTQYKVVRETPRAVQVSKVKDIRGCRERHNSERTIFSVPYGMGSVSPIMSTRFVCDQSLTNAGHLQESHCTEKHIFRPLTQGNAEVSSTIRQSLFFIKKRRERKRYRSRIALRQPMTFDHNTDEVKRTRGRFKVEKLLRDLCKSTEQGIRLVTPQVFSELISKMRLLDRMDMERVFYLLKTKDLCSSNDKTVQFFLDALPATANRASLKLMTILLTSGDVKGVRATMWMTSIGFITSPTVAMLKEVKPLLEHKRTRSRAVLPVSSLIHNFCLNHVTQCSNQRVVTDILTSIQARLGHWCDARGWKRDQVILSLRALGNVGYVTQATSIINKCLIRVSNPLGVRIAAAESFRRMPCEKQRRHRRYLWQLFTSSNIDIELRIASYLAMMRCADASFMTDILGRVNKMASREEESWEDGDLTKDDARSDSEVKAFVYSHLVNIQESSSPHKQTLGEVIKRFSIKRLKELNPLNMSSNVEFSATEKQLNIGYTAERNILWSGDSRLPRALHANLTLDLFGRSFNFIDLGARGVRLEDHLETVRERYEQGKLSFWLRRHMPKEVEGHGFIRIFGNEVLFLRMSDLAAFLDGDKSRLLPVSLDDLLTRVSGDHEKTLTWATPLLDVSSVIPTASGFPIRLKVNGSAVVDLGFKGKVDLSKVFSRSSSLNIDGELNTRATMEITGSLTVDATVTKVGLRMRNTAIVNTGIKGRILLDKGSNFKLELDTPRNEQVELFQASSKFYSVYGDREKWKQIKNRDRRTKSKTCTGKKMAAIFGLELCAESHSPIPALKSNYAEHLLNGPARIGAILYKKDNHEVYRLSANSSQGKKNGMFQIQLDTPGSKVNRKLELTSTINYPKKQMAAALSLPWRDATINVTLASRRGLHLATGTVFMKETGELYAGSAELRSSSSHLRTKLRPKFVLIMPGSKDIILDGAVSIFGNSPLPRSLHTDLSLSGIGRTSSTLKGKFINTDQEKTVKLDLVHKRRLYSFHWVNQMTSYPRGGVSVNSKVDMLTSRRRYLRLVNSLAYKKFETLKLQTHVEIYKLLKKFQLHVSLSRSVKQYRSSYDAEIWFKSLGLSAKFKGELQTLSQKLVTSQFEVSYWIPEVTKNQIQLKTRFQSKSKGSHHIKWVLTSAFNIKSNPEYDLYLTLGLGLLQRQDDLDLRIRYGNDPKDKIHFNVEIKKLIRGFHKAALSYNVALEVTPLDIDVSLSGKHHHTLKALETSLVLHKSVDKAMSISVRLENHSRRLRKYNGGVEVFWQGKEYNLDTVFDQKSVKLLVYRVTFTEQGVMTFGLSSQVETPKFKISTVETEIFVKNSGKITVGTTFLAQGRRLYLSGAAKVSRTMEIYGFKLDATRPKTSIYIKVNSEIFYPGRRVTLKMTGANKPEKQGCQVEVNLNADRKSCGERCLINAKSLIIRKTSGETERVWAKLDLSTPFKNLTKLGIYSMYALNSSQHFVDTSVYWGLQKKKKVTGELKVRNPIGWDSLHADCNIKTPLEGYQSIATEISHQLSPEIVTFINTAMGFPSENMDAVFWRRGNIRDFKISSELNSNTRYLSKTLTMNIEHSDDNEKMKGLYSFFYDKDRYSCDLTANLLAPNGLRDVQSAGDILLQTPANSISSKWDHSNTISMSNSSLQSSWNNENLKLVLHATQHGWEIPNASRKTINSSVTFESTQTYFRNATVVIDHVQGPMSLNNRIEVFNGTLDHGELKSDQEKGVLAVSNVRVNWTQDSAEANYTLNITEWENPITANAKTTFSALPYNGNVVVQWSPNKTVSAQGFIHSLQWDDFDIQATTESLNQKIPNSALTIKGRWLKEDRVFKMHPKAVLDYGSNKNITLYATIMSSYNFSNADLCFLSPFEGHSNVTVHSSYNCTDPRATKAQAEVKVEGTLKATADINVDLKNLKITRVSGDVATPNSTGFWEPLSNITLEHKSEDLSGDLETNALFKYKARTVAIHNFLSITDADNVAHSFLLQTPFNNFKKVGAAVSYQRTINNFTAQASSTVGRYMQFDGNIERRASYNEKIVRTFWNVTAQQMGTIAHDLTMVRNKLGSEIKCALKTPFENFQEFSVHGACFAKRNEFFNITSGIRVPSFDLNNTELSFYHSKLVRRVVTSAKLDIGNFSFGSDLDTSYQLPNLHATASMYQGEGKIKVSAKYKKVPPRNEAAKTSSTTSDLSTSTSPYSSSSSFSKSKSSGFSWLQPLLFFGSDSETTTTTTTPVPTLPPPTLKPTGNLHDLKGLVDLGHGNLYKMNSELDLRSQPIIFAVEMVTPIENLQHLNVNMTHLGKRLADFQTSASVNSTMTGAISASAVSDIQSLSDFSAEATLRTDKLLPADMNDWRLKVVTLKDTGGTKCDAIMHWIQDKEITLNAVIRKQPTWYSTRHILDASLKSPFENFKATRIQAEYSLRPNVSSERISEVQFALQHDEMADFDIRYQNSGSRLVTVKVRRPCAAHLIGECLTLPEDGGRLLNLSWQGSVPDFEKRKIKGEMSVDTTGAEAFSGFIAATFADDLNKTLTFTSQLINHAPRGSCCNHSLHFDLKRPSNDLDLSAVSNVYWQPEQLGTNLKVTYLKKNELTKIADLSGKLDRLRKDLMVSITSRKSGLKLNAGIQNGLALRKYSQQNQLYADPVLEFPPRNITQLFTLVTDGGSQVWKISDEMRTISKELEEDFCEVKDKVTSELQSIWDKQVNKKEAPALILNTQEVHSKQEPSLAEAGSKQESSLAEVGSEQESSLAKMGSHGTEQPTSAEQDGSDDNGNQWSLWGLFSE